MWAGGTSVDSASWAAWKSWAEVSVSFDSVAIFNLEG